MSITLCTMRIIDPRMYKLLHKLRKKYIASLPQLDSYEKWVYLEKYFSKNECDAIIDIGKKKPFKEATIGSRNANARVDQNARKSKVNWIRCNEESVWIFKKIESALHICNKRFYHFNLIGFSGNLQLTEYGLGDHFGWHQDTGTDENSTRKLSFTVQLTDPHEYEGGDLEFIGDQKNSVPREKGTVIIFPAFQHHRVTPVTSGTRHALVGWMHGPHFK